ncbi:ubiquitin carboxyl-terminal hydrolase 10-like [Glandiceps talaboti]
MSLSHTELSFGDFSGLSQEEYKKLFSTLSRPLSNNKVQFPWNEEEYIQSGIQALSIEEIPVSDTSNYVVTDAQTTTSSLDSSKPVPNVVSQNEGSLLLVNEQTTTAESSKENFCEGTTEQTSTEDYSVGFGNGDEDSGGTGIGNNGGKRRRKKKRDPSYYLKYYDNPELYHNENSERDAKNGRRMDYQTELGEIQNVPLEKSDSAGGGIESDLQGACTVDSSVPDRSKETDSDTSTGQISVITNNINSQQLRSNSPLDTEPVPPRTKEQNVQVLSTEAASILEVDKTLSVESNTTPQTIGNQNSMSENVTIKGDQGITISIEDEKEASVSQNSSKTIDDEDACGPISADSTLHTAEEELHKLESTAVPSQSVPTDSPAISDEKNPLVVKPETSLSEGVQEITAIDSQSDNDSISKPKVSSWAGLFKNTATPASGPIAYVSHASSSVNEPAKTQTVAKKSPDEAFVQDKPVSPEEDKLAKELGEFLLTVKFPYRALAFQPRGLNNVGNWCYVNAILQALLACPPLYNLLKSLPVTPLSRRGQSSTPMMDSLGEFVNEFLPMPPKPGGKRTAQDLRPGAPFEPTYIYNLLTMLKSSMSIRGRQEDAEEFLGFILNGLHEEMLSCTRYVNSSKEETKPNNMNGPSLQNSNGPSDGVVVSSTVDEDEDDNDEEWEQVGPKNKSSITRSANFTQSLISDIFGGQMRSALHQHGSKESATLQPFFTLQLDIQSDKIWSVKDALQSLVSRETLHDYTSPKTKTEVETFRRITLEVLPPVLVLHLKRFVYDKSGGCQKLQKKIEYNVDLEISKELLSSVVKSKLSMTQRSYKLFAIVYHHGKNASGGHYTCDFYHPGINGWIRTDDNNVKAVTITSILRPAPPKVPYLLFYRRCDLI